MTYGTFSPPHERAIPTEELAADYERLAGAASRNAHARYYVRYERDGEPHYGVLEGEAIHRLDTHYFADPAPTGHVDALGEVRLLAPLDPNHVSKVLGVALNTIGPDLPAVPPRSHPIWFLKSPTSITGPGGGIEVPEEATDFVHETELVLVIGRTGRHLSVEQAPAHIFGVTVGNDLTEFLWFTGEQSREIPNRAIGKAVDTFAPIGPAIVAGLDYANLRITHRLNGEVTQEGNTADRLQGAAELVAHASRFVTLLPGDILFTGASPFRPGARRVVRPGDELEAEVEDLGVLRNRAVTMGGVRWEGGATGGERGDDGPGPSRPAERLR